MVEGRCSKVSKIMSTWRSWTWSGVFPKRTSRHQVKLADGVVLEEAFPHCAWSGCESVFGVLANHVVYRSKFSKLVKCILGVSKMCKCNFTSAKLWIADCWTLRRYSEHSEFLFYFILTSVVSYWRDSADLKRLLCGPLCLYLLSWRSSKLKSWPLGVYKADGCTNAV